MEYFIAGGCGFVGSNLIPYILNRDEEATVINLDINHSSTVDGFMNLGSASGRYTFVEGDVADLESYEEYLKVADVVINLAVENSVSQFEERMDRFIRTNIMGSRILSDSSAKNGIPMVHLSTDQVYGSCPITVPRRDENSPLNPTNSYATTMAAGERLLEISRRRSKLPLIVLRTCELIGPNQALSKTIPSTIKSIKENKPPTIKGTRGDRYRDWLHVLDLCSAIDFVVGSLMGETESDGRDTQDSKRPGMTVISGTDVGTKPTERGSGYPHQGRRVLSGVTAFNVTSEIRMYVSDMVRKVMEIMGSDLPIQEVREEWERDIGYNASGRKIHYQGWSARYTDLDEILKSTIDWYLDHEEILRTDEGGHLKP